MRIAAAHVSLMFSQQHGRSIKVPLFEQVANLTPDQVLLALAALAGVAVFASLWALSARRRADALSEALEAERARLAELDAGRAAAAARETALEEQIADQRLEIKDRDSLIGAHRENISELEKDAARMTEALRQERRAAEEKQALLLDGRERMTAEFKELADQVMRRHGEDFSKTNKTQIDAVLTPLREHISKFEKELRESHAKAGEDRASLQAQIKGLSEMSAGMGKQAEALTRALKGDVQKQGAWGEMVLERILESSGLREGEEYETQASHSLEDGRRLRPDAIVNLPEGRRLILDSKVSLTDFQRAAASEDETGRAAAIKAHSLSLRAHIANLSGKEYQRLHVRDLDYVVMFVPIEGAFSAALTEDPELTSYALERDVMIATPTTLMVILRTVANVWAVDRRNRNAEAIAERAGLLYDKAAGFVDDLSDIGARLEQARSAYDGAMAKLSTGRGNLLGQIDKLKDLGAKTSKTLPMGHDREPDEETHRTPDAPDALSPPRAAE